MKILIVDDDPDVVNFLREAAEAKGYTDIQTARSAEEALAQAIRSEFDLITLDIRMPGASGLEILGMLRSMSPHAAIALVSGHFEDPMPTHTTSCADVMISKPVNLQKLHDLFDGVARVVDAFQDIRSLGDVPVPEE